MLWPYALLKKASTLVRNFYQVQHMNLTDATLVLLLAARIHGTDEGVRTAAKSVVKKLPRSKRDLIYSVISSQSPLELVRHVAKNLDT